MPCSSTDPCSEPREAEAGWLLRESAVPVLHAVTLQVAFLLIHTVHSHFMEINEV